MHALEIVLLLLLASTILAEFASKIRISYPILLVIVGMLISFVPGLKEFEIDPEVVFIIFLPPLLYAAAWTTSWPEFKAAKRSITLLAIGCVLFTTTAVAWVAHWLIPGFGWAEGFLLGAIISPPDAVAATTATKGMGLHRRVITILEGESLVNDATGLTAYRYALAAMLTGSFSIWEAGLSFVWSAGGGILIGLGIAYVIRWVHRHTPNTPRLDSSLTVLTPFVAYLTAEELHASGVMSVVAAGLFLSRHSAEIFTQRSRITANAVWEVLVYLLNSIVFILIGTHLPNAIENMEAATLKDSLLYGAIISLTVIVGRILWVFPGAYVPRWLSPTIRRQERGVTWQLVTVVAWTGMRGVVSLAAALAIPLTLPNGQPFPYRDLIFFITFCVIFSTLVLQGLTLPALIRVLGIRPSDADKEEEMRVRLEIAEGAILYIEENLSYNTFSDEVLGMIKSKYEIRIGNLTKRLGQEHIARMDENEVRTYLDAQLTLLQVERDRVLALRRNGRVDEETVRQLEYELDLEESRYMLELEGRD